jgi:hypothetical protein
MGVPFRTFGVERPGYPSPFPLPWQGRGKGEARWCGPLDTPSVAAAGAEGGG